MEKTQTNKKSILKLGKSKVLAEAFHMAASYTWLHNNLAKSCSNIKNRVECGPFLINA